MPGDDGKGPEAQEEANKDAFIMIKFHGETASIAGIGYNLITVGHLDAASAELKRQAEIAWAAQKKREHDLQIMRASSMPKGDPFGNLNRM